jgi:hypothetical protein
MKIFLACTLTALITAGALTGLGLARSSRGQSSIACGSTVEGTGYAQHRAYVCTLQSMPALGGEAFELRLPVIDIGCNAYAADSTSNLPAMLSCDRLSLSSIRCVDGVFGSWAVVMSARRFEVDSPQQCVMRSKPPGYKLTSGYTPHVFLRNP